LLRGYHTRTRSPALHPTKRTCCAVKTYPRLPSIQQSGQRAAKRLGRKSSHVGTHVHSVGCLVADQSYRGHSPACTKDCVTAAETDKSRLRQEVSAAVTDGLQMRRHSTDLCGCCCCCSLVICASRRQRRQLQSTPDRNPRCRPTTVSLI
jgi:hypothetical protein